MISVNKPTKLIFPLLCGVLTIDCIASGIFSSLLLYLLIMLNYGVGATTPLLKYLQNNFFGSGFVLTLNQTYLFIAPLIGYCSDRFGRKKCLMTAMFCAALGYSLILLCVLVKDFTFLIFGLFFMSIGNTDLPLIAAATTDISKNKKRAKYFGLIQMVLLVTAFASQFTNLMLLQQRDVIPVIIFLLKALIVFELLNLTLVTFLLPETHNKPERTGNKLFTTNAILLRLSKIFFRPQQRVLLLILLVVYFAWGLYFQQIFTFLTQYKDWPAGYANIFSFCMLSIMMLGFAGIYPWLIKRKALKRLLIQSLCLTAVCFIACGLLMFSGLLEVLTAVILILSLTVTIPLLWYSLSRITEKQQQGLLLGIIAAAWAVMWMISNAIMATISSRAPANSFWIITIVGFFMLLLMYPKLKKSVVLAQGV